MSQKHFLCEHHPCNNKRCRKLKFWSQNMVLRASDEGQYAVYIDVNLRLPPNTVTGVYGNANNRGKILQTFTTISN